MNSSSIKIAAKSCLPILIKDQALVQTYCSKQSEIVHSIKGSLNWFQTRSMRLTIFRSLPSAAEKSPLYGFRRKFTINEPKSATLYQALSSFCYIMLAIAAFNVIYYRHSFCRRQSIQDKLAFPSDEIFPKRFWWKKFTSNLILFSYPLNDFESPARPLCT